MRRMLRGISKVVRLAMSASIRTNQHSRVLLAAASASMLCTAARSDGYALQFAADTVLSFPHHAVMNTGERVTIEGWISAQPNATGGVVLSQRGPASGSNGVEHKWLWIYQDGSIGYLYTGSPWQSGVNPGNHPPDEGCPPTLAATFPLDGQFHHVAFVRHQDGSWKLFLDGAMIVSRGPGTGLGSGCWTTCSITSAITPTLFSGCCGASGWAVDGWRVSSLDRYASNFVPSRAWVSDASTVMLLSFDEGSGSVVHDHGPASQLGGLSGSYSWVQSGPSCHVSNLATCYCVPKTNSLGCIPALAATGTPALSGSDDFFVLASNVLSQTNGMMFWGGAQQFIPFQGGTLCVQPPLIRTPIQNSGGTPGAIDCTGAYAFLFSTGYMTSHFLSPGQHVFAQFYSRDNGFPPPTNVGLTGGIRFVVGP